ncbi:hypothetical protein D3C83_30880 [compost metagenome]
MHQHRRAPEPPITHEEIGSEADEKQRLGARKLAQQRAEVVEIGGNVAALGNPAGAPGYVPSHRLGGSHLASQSGEVFRLAHLHQRCPATS